MTKEKREWAPVTPGGLFISSTSAVSETRKVTRELVKFALEARFEDFPTETVEVTKKLLFKTVTGMVSGSREHAGEKLTKYLSQIGGLPEAGVVCGGFRTSVENAALAGGTLAHASELEDDQLPGAVGTYWVFPAIFSMAEKTKASGKELILAAIVSWEIAARMDIGIGPTGLLKGMGTGVWGAGIAAAVAAAKLMKLTLEQTMNAVSLCASQASGLLVQMGTDAHFLEAGISCRAGLLSAFLAKEGLTGQPDILEREGGLLGTLDQGKVDPKKVDLNKMVEGLGKAPFNVHKVWIKKYPCCFGTHIGIDVLRMLISEHDIKYEQVEKVEVEVNKMVADAVDRPPRSLGDARFSFYYVLGEVLLRGKVDQSSFTEERLADPKLKEATSKVRMIVHPEWPVPFLGGGTQVTVTRKDGQRFTKRLEQPIGGPQQPLTMEQIVSIYRQYTAGILEERVRNRVEEIMLNLERQETISELMDLLTSRPAVHG